MLSAQNLSEDLIAKLEKGLENNHIPGAMIGIVQNDSILFSEASGMQIFKKKRKSQKITFSG